MISPKSDGRQGRDGTKAVNVASYLKHLLNIMHQHYKCQLPMQELGGCWGTWVRTKALVLPKADS